MNTYKQPRTWNDLVKIIVKTTAKEVIGIQKNSKVKQEEYSCKEVEKKNIRIQIRNIVDTNKIKN